MKLGSAKKVHYDSGPNMTPLVDVVMVILIFLMLTGSFAGLTHYLTGNMALGLDTDSVTPGALRETRIDIRVERDRTNPGRMIASVGSSRFDNSASLGIYLTSLHETLNDRPADTIQVIIRAGKRVSYENVVGAFSAATEAGFSKIAFGPTSDRRADGCEGDEPI